jgi:hypothetical protein
MSPDSRYGTHIVTGIDALEMIGRGFMHLSKTTSIPTHLRKRVLVTLRITDREF